MGQETITASEETTSRNRLPRRWAEALLFVATWMGLGWSLGLEANSYLLIGIPLTILFQRLVRRVPLRALWVREAPPFGLGWLLPAAGLVIVPAYSLIGALGRHQWVVGGWMASAVLGAVAAGYALRHFRRETIRPFLLCQLTAGSIGIGLMIAARAARSIHLPPLPLLGLQDFLLYFPVCFLLEEVSFRGALDSHLHHPGEPWRRSTALLGSALWGVWHLPTLPPEAQGFGAALALAVSHSIIGVPLALYWRKGGNLVVPAFAHALIDATRNALRILG